MNRVTIHQPTDNDLKSRWGMLGGEDGPTLHPHQPQKRVKPGGCFLKHVASLACLSAVMLSSSITYGWREPLPDRSQATGQESRVLARQWQAYQKAQARHGNLPASGRAFHVPVPPRPAEPPQEQPQSDSRPHTPYYPEQAERDIIGEMFDWFLSIPAGVLSRLEGAGSPDPYPPIPTAQGGGYGNQSGDSRFGTGTYSAMETDEDPRPAPPHDHVRSGRGPISPFSPGGGPRHTR